MNSMVFMDFDLALFKNFFGSKEDKEENNDKKEEKKENKNDNNKKKDIKKETKKENQNQRSKSESNKDKGRSNENKQSEKEENNINKIIIEKDEDIKGKDKIEDDNKNIIINEVDKKNKKNKGNKKKKEEKKEKNRTKEQLLNYLVKYIKKVYLFKKSVKKLIQLQKENYAITSSVNSGDLTMEIYLSEDKTQKVKNTYEPILKENIF